MAEIKIGALLRAYSTKPDGVQTLIANLSSTVRKLASVDINDVQIGIWADPNNPAADCGKTFDVMFDRMRNSRGSLLTSNARMHETKNGDLFVAILNEGLNLQNARGLSHSLILSWEAASYVDATLINNMKQAVLGGALAVGVALPEIAEFVSQGAIMNTLALWDIEKLLEVGGFDPHDTKPRYTDHYAESNAGVGEFIPLLKLTEKHKRPVLAVLKPARQGAIEVPPDRAELQRKKLESKHRRIQGMLATIGKTTEDLRATIITGYPC